MQSELEPAFVHASPRSGSTYFFNVLRRIDSLMCYNEAINDAIGYWGKQSVTQLTKRRKWEANHKFLERDDFAEIIEAWDAVMHHYPPFPTFQDYFPLSGVVRSDLHAYLSALANYAQSKHKRPVFCETHSRGRAGALRGAFGGFHIAQYRDPLSQFGSFYRPLAQAGEWYFLIFPMMELGFGGRHPLCSLVPEAWRVPVKLWRADDPAQQWASKIEFMTMAASPRPDAPERVFRWHLLAWVLSNLAAICYSDFVLDIDRAYDDPEYRESVVNILNTNMAIIPDFNDLSKFSRYYEFEAFDTETVCDQVASTISGALREGRLDGAVRTLGTQPPTVSPAIGVDLLLEKIRKSLASMQASTDLRYVSIKEWEATAKKHRTLWFNPGLRSVGRRVYPLAAPIMRAARRAAIWH